MNDDNVHWGVGGALYFPICESKLRHSWADELIFCHILAVEFLCFFVCLPRNLPTVYWRPSDKNCKKISHGCLKIVAPIYESPKFCVLITGWRWPISHYDNFTPFLTLLSYIWWNLRETFKLITAPVVIKKTWHFFSVSVLSLMGFGNSLAGCY